MNLNQPLDQKAAVALLAAEGSVAGSAGIGMGEGMAVEVAPPAKVRLKLPTRVPRCSG